MQMGITKTKQDMEKQITEPTPEQQRFMLTGEQKVKMAALAKAFEECRKAGIQFFITDGENALMAYNTTDYDTGPTSGDNLSGEWVEQTDEHGNKRNVFVQTPDERKQEWDEIPTEVCDRIEGGPLDVDFISWGCCCEGLFAHRRYLPRVTEPEEMEFYSIESDGQGGKQIHILGYTYASDNNTKDYWRVAEGSFMIFPLQEFIDNLKQDEDHVNNLWCDAKQYEGEYTDEQVVDIINHYFNGRTANRRLHYSEITIDTPCGDYIA